MSNETPTQRAAREKKELSNKLSSIGDLSAQAGSLFGDTSQLASEGDFNMGQGLQSAGIGISGASSAIALGATGPVGAAVGAAMFLGSFAVGRKKRRKAREAAERKWRAGLDQYKQQVRSIKRQTEKSEIQINKAIGAGIQFDLLDQARQDATTAEKLTQASRGVEATTYKKSREAQADVAVGEFEALDDRLALKLDLLDEAEALAEKELTAQRDVFGSYKTEYADKLTSKLEEIERV